VNPAQIFLAGIDPDHVPALLAPLALLFFPLLRKGSVDVSTRTFAWLMAVSAAVHIALPLGHHDNLVLAVAFLGSGAAYGVLAYRALTGRRYKTLSVLLILAMLVAYLSVVLSGNEGPDQVGIATALVELVALGLCLVPAEPKKTARKAVGGTAFVLTIIVTGTITWIGALAQHAAANAGVANHAGHEHGTGARAQAGVLMANQTEAVPTPDEVRGAVELVARTKAGLVRYTDIRAALAAGYRPTLTRTGYSVHLENKAYTNDGAILDAQRPEELMYAIADGKATLLSAVYTVPYAGKPAPTPGGPLTHWHSHNICLTVLPPGFTIVDAYGTCPPFAVKTAMPLMMHVWVVDNPGGPYTDGESDAWTRAFNQAHGIPFHW
jgi:hypothetical protein